MRMGTLLVAALLSLAAVAVVAPARPVGAVTDVAMNLAGPAINGKVPVGTVRYHSDASDTTLKITVFRVWLPANTILTARVGTTVIGTMTIRTSGAGALINLSQHAGDTIPLVTAASAITVKKADGTLIVSGPQTGTRYAMRRAAMTGAPIAGKTPAGSVSYYEYDYGYARKLRILAMNINLPGERLDLYVGGTLLPSYFCTVTTSKMCIISTWLVDSDPVHNLTTSSVVKLKRHTGGAVVLTSGAWQ